jgi:hypothetical protein
MVSVLLCKEHLSLSKFPHYLSTTPRTRSESLHQMDVSSKHHTPVSLNSRNDSPVTAGQDGARRTAGKT